MYVGRTAQRGGPSNSRPCVAARQASRAWTLCVATLDEKPNRHPGGWCAWGGVRHILPRFTSAAPRARALRLRSTPPGGGGRACSGGLRARLQCTLRFSVRQFMAAVGTAHGVGPWASGASDGVAPMRVPDRLLTRRGRVAWSFQFNASCRGGPPDLPRWSVTFSLGSITLRGPVGLAKAALFYLGRLYLSQRRHIIETKPSGLSYIFPPLTSCLLYRSLRWGPL
jgi:hypothetical protein